MRTLVSYQKKFGHKVLQYKRIRKGMTQTQAAKHMGLGESVISRIESGAYHAELKSDTRRKLLAFYGKVINQLYPKE